ncbi:MAG: protein-glutamate O-methyltransferase CheR [Gammaproteobacteria bacterium]
MNIQYTFNDNQFEKMRLLVLQYTGISVSDSKRDLVYNRFAKRMRTLGLGSFDEYFNYLSEYEDNEIEHFSNAITTNLTYFFREQHHFQILEEKIIPILKSKVSKRIRIWSAGCSTGEEPYSIAMTLHRVIPNLKNWDVKILATDLDSIALKKAKSGVYVEGQLKNITEQMKNDWFQPCNVGNDSNEIEVIPSIKSLITFNYLNLMHDWPMAGPFDVIFCRNVVIYFDKDTQRELFIKFSKLQNDDAFMIMGHSENLSKITDDYKHIGQTAYQKVNHD